MEGPARKGKRLAWAEGEVGGSFQRLPVSQESSCILQLPPLSPIRSLVLSLASIRTKSRSRLKAQLGPALLHVTNLQGFISPMSLRPCNSGVCPRLQSSDLLVPKGFFDDWLHNPLPTPLEPSCLSLPCISAPLPNSGLSALSGGCLTAIFLHCLHLFL